LTGVYDIGAPVSGRAGFVKAGGDLLALTQQGVVSLAKQLVSTRADQATDPLTSDKIQYLISEAITTYSQFAGWDIKYYSKLNMLLINVPSAVAGGTTQFAANQLTSSWTVFSGMDAGCWGTLDQNPMFGTYDGRIMSAWNGNNDNVDLAGSLGDGIVAEVQQAYSYAGRPATQKQVGMYRPTFITDLSIAFSSRIEYDFTNSVLLPPDPTPLVNQGLTLWDTAIWNTNRWNGGSTVQQDWIQAEGMGTAASLRMVSLSIGDVLWVSTGYSLLNGVGLF
jgi:hypothetical protein